MEKYEIWLEGFSITGSHGKAECLGIYEGETFEKACETALEHEGYDMDFYNDKTNTYWGCRLFDNEGQARASFG